MKNITGNKLMLLGISLISIGTFMLYISDGPSWFSDMLRVLSFVCPAIGIILTAIGFMDKSKE